MSQISTLWGHYPGMGTLVETFESAYTFGTDVRYWNGATISANAVDAGNTPTSTLRMGLVMGKILATGLWTNYVATNTDGSEIAAGVLPFMLRMQDVLTETNTPKFFPIMISGGVHSASLLGLDNMARAQMSQQGFLFDDDFPGNGFFPWQRFQTKTANYQIVASDNLSNFNNLGAAGEVDFTLPPILNGYSFGFVCMAAQILKVISNEGTNIVTFNNASATSVAYATGGSQIGGVFHVYSNPAATKWIVEQLGSNTLTVA